MTTEMRTINWTNKVESVPADGMNIYGYRKRILLSRQMVVEMKGNGKAIEWRRLCR